MFTPFYANWHTDELAPAPSARRTAGAVVQGALPSLQEVITYSQAN